ncbi:MAG: periplasmic heavy metal sensor [Alphaproteobacteria bacterium]|nr:periplasmic heavy metal sensor [Alphaproteobacteria bacterium]
MSNANELQRTPRAANVALIVSVCLNLILVGLIVTAVVRVMAFHPMFGPGIGPPDGHGVPIQRVLAPHAMIMAAPGERDRIHAVIQAHREQITKLRSDALNARREVMRQFTQPNFDKAAFDAALARMHAADIALEAEVLKIVSDSAATLTPDERRSVAAQAREDHAGRFWGGHGRAHGGEGD